VQNFCSPANCHFQHFIKQSAQVWLADLSFSLFATFPLSQIFPTELDPPEEQIRNLNIVLVCSDL